MKEDKFKKGDKVKVDRSGSGKGIQFLTIKDSFVTDNTNGYKDYNFDELDENIRYSEYYIRHITKSDLKLKKLYVDKDIENYEIDTDDILRDFWKSQKDNIIKATDFINNFLYSYLIEYKHILSIDKMNDWDSFYTKGFHTKNNYLFVIKHENLNIVVVQGCSYVVLYITSPDLYYDIKKNNRKQLGVYDITIEYTDDVYKNHMLELVKAIIYEYEKSINSGYYHIQPKYKIIDKVKSYKDFLLRGNYNDFKNEIPSNYTYALRQLNYLKHYFFNKGFK